MGKLITEFTSPIAQSTSPGLSDTTFFARCGLNLHCSKSHSSGRGLSRYQVSSVDCWHPCLMKVTFCHFLKMEYITFLSSGCTKSKFLKIVFVFKSDTATHSSSTFFSSQFSYFVVFPCLFVSFFLLFVFSLLGIS